MHLPEMSPENKALIDLTAISTMLGSLVDILPAIAALFTIIWTGIRIIETETVRGVFRKKGED